VRPFLVRERAGRAEGHHEDERLCLSLRDELVFDDAHADGEDESKRASGKAVQEVQHGIAPLWLPGVAGREVDLDAGAAPAERRVAPLDGVAAPLLPYEGGVGGGREAAVKPVVPSVTIDADEADSQEGTACDNGEERKPPPGFHQSRCNPASVNGWLSNREDRYRRYVPKIVRALLLVVLVAGGCVDVAQARSAPARRDGAMWSPAVKGRLRLGIYLPAGYASSGRRYPVVYFLHGLPASPTSFRGADFLAQALHASGREAIIVAPQGARDNDSDPEYLDWGSGRNWETAITRDIVGYVDSRFRTI